MMAKRSNNSRSKKLLASKPYDISNSFVKKVASRVTELFPQSLWPTKWFSSTTSETYSPGDGRKLLNSPHVLSDFNVTEEIASSRTARIPLDSSVNDPLFAASISASDFKGRRLKNSMVTSSEDVEDRQAVAGPSGLHNKLSAEKAIRGKQKSRDGLSYNTRQLEVNGEDHSDSSESTSGCSSLPQMDNNVDVRNSSQAMADDIPSSFPQPVLRSGAKRRRQEEPLYSPMNNSSLLPSLESFTSGKTVPVGRRRNPSFNPDIFGPQSWSGEKTNIKDRIVNSPFYSGRTTYGGISAYQNHSTGRSNQEPSGLRSIRVQPVKTAEAKGDSAAGMSNTARRILEALEMFSSPIQDAKKIPLRGSMNIKRRKILSNTSQQLSNSPSSSEMSLGACNSYGEFTPPVKELIVPTVPDILALRRRQRLQGSTVAAREVANDTNVLPFSTEKVSDNVNYWTSEKSGGGKIRSKKEIDEETVEKPNLPNISLPISSLPKFDFILSSNLPSHSQKQTQSSKFKFSSPIAVTSVSESFVTSNKFTFSSPQKATERENSGNSSRTGMLRVEDSAPKESVKVEKDVGTDKIASKSIGTGILAERSLKSSSEYKSSCKNVLSSSVAPHGQISSNVLQGSNEFSGKNALVKDSNSSKSEEDVTKKNSQILVSLVSEDSHNDKKANSSKATNMVETKSGFGDKFKPPSGSWSCDVCMVSNPSDHSKCLACETPRKSSAPAAAPVSGETKSTSSSFGEQFKKPEGAWDCPICMVRNKAGGPPKCVACEAPQPGSESASVDTQSSNSSKFPLGSSINSGFQFGIDKAGNLPMTSTDSKPSFTFGGNPTTTGVDAFASTSSSSGFTFGIKSEGNANALGFTFGIPTTKESHEVDGIKKPAVSQSSSLFGNSGNQMSKPFGADSAKLPLSSGPGEVVEKSEIKLLKPKDNKPEGVIGASSLIDDVARSKTSAEDKVKLNAPTAASSNKEMNPAISFVSPTEKSSSNNLGKDSTVSNGKWKVDAKPSNNVSANSSPVFNSTTPVPSWNFTLPSQSSPFSSPKSSFFPQVNTSAASATSDSLKKQEETTKTPAPDFKFGDGSKFEFMVPAVKSKSQEVPTTSSSGFKFQELTKPSSPFSLDDKIKTTSSITTSVTSNLLSSNTFKSATSTASISEKPQVTSEKPSTLLAPSFSDSPAASKSSHPGPVFMFGSEGGSNGSTFNLAGQKPFAQATKDEPPKMFSNVGAPSGGFNLGKSPTFGSVTSAPSLTTSTSITVSSGTMPASGSLFVAPSSTSLFGSPATTSVATSSSSATTAVTTAPNAFGSSVFSQTFPTVSTPSVAFGSPSTGSSAFGASSSVFGSNTTPSSTPFSFSGSAKPAAEEQPTQPAPFVFGSNPNQSAQPFTFGASASKPGFNFGSSSQSVSGTSGQAPALPSAPALGGFSFGDPSKTSSPFGSAQPPTSVGGTSNPFGNPATNPPSFGATSLGDVNPAVTAAFGTPAFNFGSAQSNPTFTFGTNQSTSLQPNLSQPSGFSFGQVSQASSAQQSVAPQFNPNLPPSFNFTNGATPQFTATPLGLSVQPSANTMQRRFKKAVRRTTQPR